jgi:ribokinase
VTGSPAPGGPPERSRSHVAVVGHVEFVEFIPVQRLPEAGEVVHGGDSFQRPAGGGGVAGTALAALGAEVELFCALGRDQAAESSLRQLRERGVEVHAARRDRPTRRAVTLLEHGGERTIVTLGERLAPCGDDPLPWQHLDHCTAVYFTAGDSAALAHARRARVVVATPRAGDALHSGPPLDALVYSDGDPIERDWAEQFRDRARITVATTGEHGGRWWGESSGRWEAVPPPGPVLDTYGAGDTFAAVLAHALGAGEGLPAAIAVAARWGAAALTHPGAPW